MTTSGKIDYQSLRRSTLRDELDVLSKETLTESEKLLFDIFSIVLKHRQFRDSDSFIAAGGDSLTAMEVIVRANKAGWPISTRELLGHNGSVTAIAANRDQPAPSKSDIWSTEYLRTDVQELINQSGFVFGTDQPVCGSPRQKPTRLLLTGATGFLGVRLLERILKVNPKLEVVCLVRGDNHRQAQDRLFNTLAQQKVKLSGKQAARITVCVGNIEHAKFGMTNAQYTSLADSVDHIVHSAARVNSIWSYEQLRKVNVFGTLNVAIFAAMGVFKRIDMLSTLSVFVGSDRCSGLHKESTCIEDADQMFGGYAASKWAAEFLLRQVSSGWSKNRIRYFRPGLLTADTTTNVYPERDLLTLTVRELAELGMVPKTNPRYKVDITPVDLAANAIASLVLTKTQFETFHFAHPNGLSANELFDSIRRCVESIETLDFDQFKLQMQQCRPDAPTTIVALALDRALRSCDITTPNAIDLFQATEAQFDMTNTISELAVNEHEWSPPDLNIAFVDTMVAALLDQQEKTS